MDSWAPNEPTKLERVDSGVLGLRLVKLFSESMIERSIAFRGESECASRVRRAGSGQRSVQRPRRAKATQACRHKSTVHRLVPTRAWLCKVVRPDLAWSSAATDARTARARTLNVPSVCRETSSSRSNDSIALKRAEMRVEALNSDAFDGQLESSSVLKTLAGLTAAGAVPL